jgi:hypothetical protein
MLKVGARGSVVVKVLCYKLEDREFDTRLGEFQNLPHPSGPPLWSSGQSCWLQIRRLGFDSRHYQKKIMCLERGRFSLVSTTEELLDRKVAAPA